MKSIGFPPGSNIFRLIIVVIIVVTLIVIFFDYADRISIATEEASIQQSKNIINSSLAIVFAKYAVSNELEKLNDLVGADPFPYLNEYNLLPGVYKGQFESGSIEDLDSGWYFHNKKKVVFYVPYYGNDIKYFTLNLEYRDVNFSGVYEPDIDEFNGLFFRSLP